jgi:hypothetical protein
MDEVDLRSYLLALTPQGQGSFRDVLKRDRVVRKAIPVDTLETAPWSEVVDAFDARCRTPASGASDGRAAPTDRAW